MTHVVLLAAAVATIAHLGDDAFQPDLAGVCEHLVPVHLEALAELDLGALDDDRRLAFSSRGSFANVSGLADNRQSAPMSRVRLRSLLDRD
jgi:hypothetical protein